MTGIVKGCQLPNSIIRHLDSPMTALSHYVNMSMAESFTTSVAVNGLRPLKTQVPFDLSYYLHSESQYFL